MSRYAQDFQRSLADPEGFWADAARDIDWYQAPTVVLDRSRAPFYRWFADGVMNTCFNALDRHVRDGRGQQPALIYDSPVTGTQRTYTYNELLEAVARFAGVLRGLGVDKGDRVIVYLPMIPEALIAMLACARIGAVHSVVFGGFAAPELAMRIDDAAPKVIVSASCGIEVSRVIEYKPMLDRAIELAHHKPDHCVILQRPQATAALTEGRDLDWADAWPGPNRPTACRSRPPIRCTSCTRRAPRPSPRAWSATTAGTRSRCSWSMHAIYDTQPGEVFWAASDVGWVVGHSYIVYAPLLAGCTTVLYEGKPVGTPDAGAFWRVIAEHSVKTLFTAPTAFRAIKKEDPARRAGPAVRPVRVQVPVPGRRAARPGDVSLGGRAARHPGHRPLVADRDRLADRRRPDGPRADADQARLADLAGARLRRAHPRRRRQRGQAGRDRRDRGAAAAAARMPAHAVARRRALCRVLPGPTHPGFYITGDGGYRDEDGYLYVMGRIDDVINVAGHRLSTGQMEEVLAAIPRWRSAR